VTGRGPWPGPHQRQARPQPRVSYPRPWLRSSGSRSRPQSRSGRPVAPVNALADCPGPARMPGSVRGSDGPVRHPPRLIEPGATTGQAARSAAGVPPRGPGASTPTSAFVASAPSTTREQESEHPRQPQWTTAAGGDAAAMGIAGRCSPAAKTNPLDDAALVAAAAFVAVVIGRSTVASGRPAQRIDPASGDRR
jgi:hypothetical protein